MAVCDVAACGGAGCDVVEYDVWFMVTGYNVCIYVVWPGVVCGNVSLDVVSLN